MSKIDNKYLEYGKENNSNVIFAGRLGQYKYFNMDQTVKNAIDLVNIII